MSSVVLQELSQFAAGFTEVLSIALAISLEPFLPMLQQVNVWLSAFAQSDPLSASLWGLAGVIVYSFVWSILCNNVSKVDQIWSIVPGVYMWIFWLHYYLNHGVAHLRLTVLTLLVTVWGMRLTYNFWRKGGYGNLITHEEDYRWPILREQMHPATFFFFNLTFIATYQVCTPID
jgi:steroid 5-alpha reductase family enzyme